jgi:large repetitive protein
MASAYSMFAATSAPAATVTIGSPLTGSYFQSTFTITGTLANSTLPEPGANLTSPAAGTIVSWRIMDGSGGPFRLRVLTPGTGTAYTGGAASGPETPTGAGVETFTTDLPIQAGQTIGLDNTNPADGIGDSEFGGAANLSWAPSLGVGETRIATAGSGNELSFNAEVLIPVPAITTISPTSGSVTGGATVTIKGQGFTEASRVMFGSAVASSLSVNSDTQITAVTPPSPAPGAVDVRVTTVGGTSAATSADQFTYTTEASMSSCIVPKLMGKKLKGAKKALLKAKCRLGKVRGQKSKSAKVKRQSAKPGAMLAPGAKVNVTVK